MPVNQYNAIIVGGNWIVDGGRQTMVYGPLSSFVEMPLDKWCPCEPPCLRQCRRHR